MGFEADRIIDDATMEEIAKMEQLSTDKPILDSLIAERWEASTGDLLHCKVHNTHFFPKEEPCWQCYNETQLEGEVVSELKEITYDIITNAFIKALADIDKGTTERDKHFVTATELILKNFKAHIERCEKPLIPMASNKMISSLDSYQIGFSDGAKADRKALMESLKCSV